MTPAELKALDGRLGVALCTCAQHGRGDCAWAVTHARNALPALIRLWEAAEQLARRTEGVDRLDDCLHTLREIRL